MKNSLELLYMGLEEFFATSKIETMNLFFEDIKKKSNKIVLHFILEGKVCPTELIKTSSCKK